MNDEVEAPAEERPGGKRRRRRGRGGGTGGPQRAAQHWLLVSTPDNFRRTREHGFNLQGVKSIHKRPVETMAPGDRLLYYVSGRMAFAASATVTGAVYEDHSPIWKADRREEDYPWRVPVRPDVVVDDADWIPARHLAFRLDYVKRWPPESWALAFQGQLHQLPKVDFKLLEDELKRIAKQRRAERTAG
jgi:EVE domain-containing protein